MQISDAQSRAIAHGTGPAMVLAGPGSGKTLVITQRTKYLVEQYGVKPQEILVITFTKAAANEMRLRFGTVCRASGVTFGTFHAVFFGILKQAYHFTAANILTEEKKFGILRQLMREMKFAAEDEKELLAELAAEISAVKNEQIDLQHYYSKACPEEKFRSLYQSYEKAHKDRGLLDFDDMLVYTYELLAARADILAAWQRRFRYILVDEFQDINMLQYRILRMLAAPQNNLFIVGDDDQSIYRFRGAKPEIMLNFTKDFPDAKQILLDLNFRSSPPIVHAALRVIAQNTTRFDKKIRPARSGSSPVDIKEFENQEHESLYLVKCIKTAAEQGRALSDIAVLFRTNQGASPFAQRLMEFNLPFVMRDALPNIYEHWIAQDIRAYLHLARRRLDRAEFLQVMNRPKRYISRSMLDASVISFETLRTYCEDKEWMLDRIDRMELDLKLLAGMTPYAAVNYIRHGIGYEEYLKEYAAARRMKPEELFELLDEIQQSARPYRTFEEWQEQIEAYAARLEERRSSRKSEEDAVTLATLHSSKGLEFKEVFLVDVNEGTIPHKKASVEADFEEERRLFYVGMTRAKDKLHIFHVKERYGREQEPSQFLEELLE
ncbi:ATP-dependent helicase [Parablautia sp. Marseille-Q6255]|uniref:ATP-dependent helicase n=1 Tax=Parablautia sp. Marseille-Q6255 TaxID=3039593 RepID=UPI0024BC8242|nr:ATP-dependent helicase [Parablautia sp. Marseille-Q6255]